MCNFSSSASWFNNAGGEGVGGGQESSAALCHRNAFVNLSSFWSDPMKSGKVILIALVIKFLPPCSLINTLLKFDSKHKHVC